MTSQTFTESDVMCHLSHRPHYIRTGVISVDESAKLSISEIPREPQYSMGLLDGLPIELLHAILDHLDLRSLSRVSRVSLRGKVVVESLPAYRDLTLAAGHTFRTLSLTRSIGIHSVAKLHATLHSDRCVSCGRYGAFLALLSAERCCFACLSVNQSLWVIRLAFARDCFDLSRHQLMTLPTMKSIPGTYFVRRRVSRHRPLRLVSVRAAKELAIKVHGSAAAAMAKHLATMRLKAPNKRSREATWYHDAPLQPLRQDPLILKGSGDVPNDDSEGMGSIAFPSMTGAKIETGLWCRGCERTFELYHHGKLDRDVVSGSIPPGCDTFTFLHGLQYSARSEAEFLEHARHCYSATEVITKRWVGLF